MSKAFTKQGDDELRPEYDLTQLKGGVRGKYYKRAIAGTNLVLIEPDLARAFPDADSVNRALRILLDAAGAAAGESRRPKARPAPSPNPTRNSRTTRLVRGVEHRP